MIWENTMKGDHPNEYTTDDLAGLLKFQNNPHLSFDDRMKSLYPSIDLDLIRLPRNLSTQDKSSWIEVSAHNPFQCKYGGVNNIPPCINNLGSIRTSDPIPSECEIYYYEMLVLNAGEHGYVAIGFTANGTNLNRQPGWARHTYGYHGDDGRLFEERGHGKKYGPVFGTNDVVGCGINLRNRSCFFTKNGKFLGIAVRNLPVIKYYPTIGVHSTNECVEVNLGQKPFLYNIKMEMILDNAHKKDMSKGNL